MDAMAQRCARKCLREAPNRQSAETVIQNTYSFEYRRFRKMLIHIIGLKGLEKTERRLDPVQFQILTAELEALKVNRNNHAHTYIKGITPVIDAPSVTRVRFGDVYDALQHFDDTIKRLGF